MVTAGFAWNRDVGGGISTITLDLKKCHLYAQMFSSLNVQDELMFFLMYVMPVEIKLLMSWIVK